MKRNFVTLCSLLLALSSLLFANTVCNAAQPSQKIKIAFFPFENLSDDKDVLKQVIPVLRSRLEKKGLEILDDESLNRFLLKERIRSTGYISSDIARKLREELDVNAILVGSVNSFFPGENPRVGFSARLINSSDGSILWANHASATGEDFATVLGLGKVKTIDRLISRVIDKLLDSFSITPHYKEIESTYRIAVMPFQNKSKAKDAGMIATYMFIAELFKNKGFVPVEYGEVRRLTVDLRVRGKGELDLKNTEAISKSLGADGILVGTVELYNEGEGTLPPEVIISARLIDARKNRILWYDGYQYSGDDGIIILDWGRIRSAENVAYKAVSKLVKEMGKAKWR
ncbi:MAG: FlgO family outer membrane protein [Thermodesulfovibrionales bacterium]|nr:FlgO family outer membrane protein [Thermodesulfovibrionales bacterium]